MIYLRKLKKLGESNSLVVIFLKPISGGGFLLNIKNLLLILMIELFSGCGLSVLNPNQLMKWREVFSSTLECLDPQRESYLIKAESFVTKQMIAFSQNSRFAIP